MSTVRHEAGEGDRFAASLVAVPVMRSVVEQFTTVAPSLREGSSMSRQSQLIPLIILLLFPLSLAAAAALAPQNMKPAIQRHELTSICQFTKGPYAGTVSTIDGPLSDHPVPVGTSCTDGQGSFGIAIDLASSASCREGCVENATTTTKVLTHGTKHHNAAHRLNRPKSSPSVGRSTSTAKAPPAPPNGHLTSTVTSSPPPKPKQAPQPQLPPGIEPGLAAFRKPQPMQVGAYYPILFVAGPNEQSLSEETEGAALTHRRKIFVGPYMQVTLLPDPNFRVKPRTQALQATGADLTTTWEWNVEPLTDGDHVLTAQVDVMRPSPRGGYSTYDSYTRDVAIHITVGSWTAFVEAMRNATSVGDLFGTLFRSWQKTLLAFAAVIVAGFGVPAAIRSGLRRWRAAA